MPTRRQAVLLSLLPVLLLGLALAVGAWRGRHKAVAEELPHYRAVVLLLAPGLSASEDSKKLSWRATGGTAVGGLMTTRSDPYRPGAFLAPRSERNAFADAVTTLAYGSRSPSPGALSLREAVTRAGGRAHAVNGGPTIAPLAAPSEKTVQQSLGSAPDGYATDPKALTAAVVAHTRTASPPTLVVAVYDDLLRADREAPLCLPSAAVAMRTEAVQRMGELVGSLATALPSDTALIVLSPVPSADAMARRERLGPVLITPGGPLPGSRAVRLLASPSTRGIPGLLANTDVAATVAALLGLPEEQSRIGAGRPAGFSGERVEDWFLSYRAAEWAAQAREQRLLVYAPWLIAGLLLAAGWLAGKVRMPGVAGGLLAAAVSLPLALLLLCPVPPVGEGWAWGIHVLAVVTSAGIGALAWRSGASERWVRGVTAVTALTLLLDILAGGPLLARTPLSYSVMEGARFYGVGNEASGLLIGTSLCAAALCGRSLWTAISGGAAVALMLGLPTLGADAGGLIAALVGFGAWGVRLQSVSATKKRQATQQQRSLRTWIAVGTAVFLLGLLAAYAFWDAGRGTGERTHVGEAVASARARGMGALGEIAVRKLSVNARLLVTSPWAVLLAAEIVLLVVRLRKRDLRVTPEEYAACVAAGALLLLNDSGVVAAAACLLYPVAGILGQNGNRAGRTERARPDSKKRDGD